MKWKERGQVATRRHIAGLLTLPVPTRQEMGFGHTLDEIRQQPELWQETARRVISARDRWADAVASASSIVLTGSGSSYFVGKCAAPALQHSLKIPVVAIESGEILIGGVSVLPPVRPLLVVSFARSGDSPESWGLVRHLLESEPEVNHLLITCNPNGRLAQMWGDGGSCPDSRVRTLVLDERACDRSLVMTSSFTSMLVAAIGLSVLKADQPALYLSHTEKVSAAVEDLLESGLGPLEEFSFRDVDRIIAVGSGALHGAAHEVALKVLEMSDGRISTRAETSLGLRHGPMCGLGPGTPLFMPLSSEPVRRAYQLDLLAELSRKRLGCRKILVGADIPTNYIAEGDAAVCLNGLRGLDDEWLALATVVAGQVLAFLGCLFAGLRPDQPVVSESISRVVGGFTLHNLRDGALG